MSARAAFLDTGIFIAFLDRSDSYHHQATELFANPPRRWYSSLAVISETYGWFLHRIGEDAARQFRLLLPDLTGLELLPLDGATHDATARKLERFRGHKLTYVDGVSLVLLERHRLDRVWGTDRDLAIEGARIAPLDV